MNLDLHATGASFIAHSKDDNPRDLIIELIESNPGIDRKALFAKFRELLQEHGGEYQRKVDWYFFVNMHDYLVTNRSTKSTRTPATSQRSEVDALKSRAVEVMLMKLTLPNGKLLSEATFADCAKAGGWFLKIAKKGKPNQVVGKVLTEEQLRAVK